MSNYLGEGETPSTTIATITYAAAAGGNYGVAYGGQIYEAVDPLELEPAVADTVLIDYLPSAGQWVIVAIVP